LEAASQSMKEKFFLEAINFNQAHVVAIYCNHLWRLQAQIKLKHFMI